MGRPKRADEAGGIYHMLNRGNGKETVFHKDGDYAAFEGILAEGLAQVNLRLYSYCLLPNHWHLVVSPQKDGEMGRFGQWICLTHTQRYHAHYGTVGDGHLYQGRFKSFPIQCDQHFLTVCRYVERNAYAAKLCAQPEQWRYGSLWRRQYGRDLEKLMLSRWPIERRADWLQWVRMALTKKEREQLQWCIRRGCPFGDAGWVETAARRLGLESTMRPRGRPRKFPR